MALGLPIGGSGNGEIKPFVKYNAQAGRLYLSNRIQDVTGTWTTVDTDITFTAQYVVDLGDVDVGWINFTEQGPVRHMVKLGQPLPPRPDAVDRNGKPAFKTGFVIRLAMPKDLGGGVREFSSTADCVKAGVDELHSTYAEFPQAQAGKLPVVHIKDTVAVKSAQSTNFRPVFEILAWVDRPATLPLPAAGQTELSLPQATRPVPPSTGSRQAPPPSANDFG